jgi:hypothetical protein
VPQPVHHAREEENDRQVFIPTEVFDEFQRLVKTLVREDKIFISDRKLVKLYKLFRVRAWVFTGGTVTTAAVPGHRAHPSRRPCPQRNRLAPSISCSHRRPVYCIMKPDRPVPTPAGTDRPA